MSGYEVQDRYKQSRVSLGQAKARGSGTTWTTNHVVGAVGNLVDMP